MSMEDTAAALSRAEEGEGAGGPALGWAAARSGVARFFFKISSAENNSQKNK